MTDNSRQAGHGKRQPAVFIPHGGGPCFFMDWPDVWDQMAEHLRGLAGTLPQRPAALVVMSGHWETDQVTVTTGASPPLIYDYYGFPAHTYELQYQAPGSPELAEHIQQLLAKAGIASVGDVYRGFDHGVFIPLMLAFEKADIPVIEISLPLNATAKDVMEIGRALAPLRDENVLLVGAGMTYHNLRRFLRQDAEADEQSRHFDDWLHLAVEAAPEQRESLLARWAGAPFAQDCHPKAEHLLPLMFVAGAAGTDRGVRDYSDTVMGKALSGFRFG
ncbi:MAG: class III extradiol ring-cleavage dioxygenase [Gluconobacter sp.]|uniref:DODA-type extradiol aromatic ring-opening family dioxygenase n=1 Tax=Gluconobacter sp. TaxID=1876758 RepID=UPI0039EB2E70